MPILVLLGTERRRSLQRHGDKPNRRLPLVATYAARAYLGPSAAHISASVPAHRMSYEP